MMVAFAMVPFLSSRYRSGVAVLFFVASSIHEGCRVVYPVAENFRRDVESGDSLCAVVRRVSAAARRVVLRGCSPSDCGCAYTKNAPGKPRGWLVGRLRPTTAVDHHHVGLVLTPEQGEDLPLGNGVVEALHLVILVEGDEVAAVAERPDVAREALF